MPTGAIVGAIGAVVAAGISAESGRESRNAQQNSQNQALDFAKSQEAERRREWDIQTAAAKKQWDTEQANLAPYRSAKLDVLRKHGYSGQDIAPPPPDYSAGPPPGWKPGDPLPGGANTSQSGGGAAPWLIGGGLTALGGVGTALMAGRDQTNKDQYNTLGGPYTTTTAGVPGGPAGPPSSLMNPSGTGIVSPANLSNWSDWSNYYGTPGQTYQGE